MSSGRQPERDEMEMENRFDNHLLDVLLENVSDGIFIADRNFMRESGLVKAGVLCDNNKSKFYGEPIRYDRLI